MTRLIKYHLARGRHPALPSDKHYLHNCPAYASARLKLNRDTPVADIALVHRRAVLETSDPAAIERSFAVTRAVFDGGYAFPINDPGETAYHVTNWSSAWHRISFSPVLKPQSTSGTNETVNNAGPVSDYTSRSGGAADTSSMIVLGHALLRKSNIHRCMSPYLVMLLVEFCALLTIPTHSTRSHHVQGRWRLLV